MCLNKIQIELTIWRYNGYSRAQLLGIFSCEHKKVYVANKNYHVSRTSVKMLLSDFWSEVIDLEDPNKHWASKM